jgi:hypothetical protein
MGQKMNEIIPENAIISITSYVNQIDNLIPMTYSQGDRVKTQLKTRVRGFVRAIFRDDDKKIDDFEKDCVSRKRRLSSGQLTEQAIYAIDLECMKDHLLAYKEELELVSESKRKLNQQISGDKSVKGEIKTVALYGPAIPLPSPSEEYIVDEIGSIGVRQKNSNKIFIVHGHNDEIKDHVAKFLRSLYLDPIILHLQASLGKTIIEKVEHYSDVGYAVILLTEDDLGCTLGPPEVIPMKDTGGLFSKKESGVRIGRGWGKQRARARQNVIFEFGYFIGKLGRCKVAALCQEGIERPSDIDGLVYISLDRGENWKAALKKEIEAAGIKTGQNTLD